MGLKKAINKARKTTLNSYTISRYRKKQPLNRIKMFFGLIIGLL